VFLLSANFTTDRQNGLQIPFLGLEPAGVKLDAGQIEKLVKIMLGLSIVT